MGKRQAAPPAATKLPRLAPAVPRAPAVTRRSPVTARESPRCDPTGLHSLAPGGCAAAGATRSTRWWRPPAPGTCTQSDIGPDALLRTRRSGRNRVGLPSEPGRGF